MEPPGPPAGPPPEMPRPHSPRPPLRARSLRAWLPAAVAATVLAAPALVAQAAPPAVVTAALSSRRVPAESCVKVTTTVSPAKPGQIVRFQRRRGGAWNTWAEEVLGPMSRASASLCFAWADLGPVDLRVVWPSQDTDNDTGVSPTKTVQVTRAAWMQRIDRLVRGKAFSVSASLNGAALYRRKPAVRRAPASNEKLLLSMAILDRLGPSHRISLRAASPGTSGGVVRRNLWILGGGDPEIGRGRLKTLARRIKQAGVRRIEGRVLGSRGYFRRDWFAKGWKRYFPAREVALPTALTFEHNRARGRHIRDPERRAAAALTKQLELIGVRVRGKPGDGQPPSGVQVLASVDSRRLADVLRAQNVDSRNFYAEVLGKLLGAKRSGPPGTIRKGARAIESWARHHGARIRAFDGSGLSYKNRVSPAGMVRLLTFADGQTWASDLRGALPSGGQGTLKGRLGAVKVRAKTGTLTRISALSGWVWLKDLDTWAEFSVLSKGTSKSAAVRIEDKIVRLLANQAG